MDLTGRSLGNYESLEPLGSGAMGAVYKARDRRLDRAVALKILPPTLSRENLTRFEREARAISALNHPNIATIYSFEEADGMHFLVLEYVGGGTLGERIEHIKETNEPLAPRALVEDGLQIARGLAHAHRRGVIHRDIKADNVLVTEDGLLKVSDFGLARLEAEAGLTEEGSMVGSMAYMAPEQILGHQADARSDIFSFGVLCYALSVAELPFQSVHAAALQYEILNSEPAPLSQYRADLPDAWTTLVMRCLAKRPEDRPQSMEEVVTALETLRDELVSGSPDRSVTGPTPSRRLEIGQTLGRYRLLSKIGEGGMGSVYRARDTSLDRQVALKTLKAEAVEDSDRRRRFVQEAKAASALNHPNIVTIYEIDEREGVSYIAMELIQGETLDHRLAAGPLSLEHALRIAIPVADALAAAHAHGIVHRDLKPANVIEGKDGRVKLLDFGLAKLSERESLLETDSHSSPQTQDGVILGTVAYMSPEQAEGRPVDPRSDVFSFGSMLYEMVTGVRRSMANRRSQCWRRFCSRRRRRCSNAPQRRRAKPSASSCAA
ncbi:MAG: serine/threonine-protein kinase [Bryobacterales bacterium]